ncbi:hypothetical protein D3C85_1364460 [compost metagenome]
MPVDVLSAEASTPSTAVVSVVLVSVAARCSMANICWASGLNCSESLLDFFILAVVVFSEVVLPCSELVLLDT